MKISAISYFIFFLCLSPLFAKGQQTPAEILATARPVKISTYQIDRQSIWLPMSFGKWNVLESAAVSDLKNGDWQITQIDLVYSDYPKHLDFEELNTKRLSVLSSLFPELLSEGDIKFRLLRQTNCKNKAEAKQLPHGIAIWANKKEKKPEVLIVKQIEEAKPTPEKPTIILIGREKIGVDSTVLHVFERNDMAWMDSAVIITDLTYSMAPFTWQVLQWQQQVGAKYHILGHVFFNDGDKTPDNAKELGKTGGIYYTETHKQDSIVRLMSQVQANGNGGDIPENDLEALLFAIKQYPNAKEYVLIADSKSSIRDWELLEQLDKPIRIILARTSESLYSIHDQYISLAMKTKGSLYTAFYDFATAKDLKNLELYKQGFREDYERAKKKKN